jgi:hypothetical protein
LAIPYGPPSSPSTKKARSNAGQSYRAPRHTYYEPIPKTYQKDIVFSVLPRAITNAGSNFSGRDLYYAARPLCYDHSEWEPGKLLDYRYFSQQLLTEYQENNGPIAGMWRDARGHLLEPHTGNSIGLGTREVAAYQFPEYTFDKILYVEKEGELSKLKAAKLAERYDMAICSGKGQPTEAVRNLFEHAEGKDFQLFVFHDADIDGYNIARVMAQETRRMPGYSVDVVDIGLTIEDAVEMGLQSEPFHRKKDISWELEYRLSPMAREYLCQRDGYRGIHGQRFELNAILPDTRRIEYIERKLKEKGARGKVIPPKDALAERREKMYQEKIDGWVEKIIADILDTGELKKKMAEEFKERFKLQGAEAWIKTGFKRDDTQSWRDALNATLDAAYDGKHKDALLEDVREYITETARSKAEDEGEE